MPCVSTPTRRDDLLSRERNDLPQELQKLTAQRQREQNPDVQKQLDQVIASKSNQWQTLGQLDARMQQAQLQMDQSLTALATVYSQVQLLECRGDQQRPRRTPAF